MDVAQEAIEAGLSTRPHPLGDITGYHPNYFQLGFKATPSIPTSKRSSYHHEARRKRGLHQGRASTGLQGSPDPLPRPAPQGASNNLLLGLGKNQCTFGPLGWASRCTGRARRPIGLFSIASHCLTQYGCKGRRVSSVSDHPSNGWERPKQAGWECRVQGLVVEV